MKYLREKGFAILNAPHTENMLGGRGWKVGDTVWFTYQPPHFDKAYIENGRLTQRGIPVSKLDVIEDCIVATNENVATYFELIYGIRVAQVVNVPLAIVNRYPKARIMITETTNRLFSAFEKTWERTREHDNHHHSMMIVIDDLECETTPETIQWDWYVAAIQYHYSLQPLALPQVGANDSL